jgi:hypothetical protein
MIIQATDVIIHETVIIGPPFAMQCVVYFDNIADSDERSIADAGITNDSNLFVWDGVQVAGETVQVGASCEPVLLHVTYPAPSSTSSSGGGGTTAGEDCEYELISGFPKNSTLKELRVRRELLNQGS